jgi:hypothetical protein
MSDAVQPTETELPLVPDAQWLTAEQVAAHWAFKQGTVDGWRKDGFIAEKFLKGRRRNRRFHPAVLDELQRLFNEFGAWRSGPGRGRASVQEFFAQCGAGSSQSNGDGAGDRAAMSSFKIDWRKT